MYGRALTGTAATVSPFPTEREMGSRGPPGQIGRAGT